MNFDTKASVKKKRLSGTTHTQQSMTHRCHNPVTRVDELLEHAAPLLRASQQKKTDDEPEASAALMNARRLFLDPSAFQGIQHRAITASEPLTELN